MAEVHQNSGGHLMILPLRSTRSPRCRPARLSRQPEDLIAVRVRRQRRQGASRAWSCFRARPTRSSRSSRSRRAQHPDRRPRRRHRSERRRHSARGRHDVSFARMNRILEIDLTNERMVVEPGVVNLDMTLAVQGDKYFYAPDPSSQRACTIGGNVARTPAVRTRWPTASRRITCSASKWCCRTGPSIETGGKEAGPAGLRPDRPVHGLGRHDGAGHEGRSCG